MGVWNKILGYRDFRKLNDMQSSITWKMSLSENIDYSKGLIFFKSKRQQTWLITSNTKVYCVLDDIVSDMFEIKWAIGKKELWDGQNLKIEIIPNYKENTGLISFGNNHKNWLYSKNLFINEDELRDAIKNLII